MQENKNPSAAFLRKSVYDFLHNIGVKMTSEQQSELSGILKSVYEYRIVESRKENDAPITHEVVCPKCQGIRIFKGQRFKNYRKAIRKSGGTVAPV